MEATQEDQTLPITDTDEEPESSEVVLEVSGFKPGTTEDMLSMFFESTRRSGGGEVIEVKVDDSKNKAIIKFADESGRSICHNYTVQLLF